MSFITDVVVVAMLSENQAFAAVNAALEAAGEIQRLAPLDMAAAGGGKVISAQVWAASFNYADWYGLRDALLAAPWRFPEKVTILVECESGISQRIVPGKPVPA